MWWRWLVVDPSGRSKQGCADGTSFAKHNGNVYFSAGKPRVCADSYIYRHTFGRTGISISNCTCAGCQCISDEVGRNARKRTGGDVDVARIGGQCRHQARIQRGKQSAIGIRACCLSQCRRAACS